VNTLLFVDVDGVLNIGMSDGNEAPLLLSRDNIKHAEKLYACQRPRCCSNSSNSSSGSASTAASAGKSTRDSIEKLVSVSKRRIEGQEEENMTYGDLACGPPCGDISDVLVASLASLLQKAWATADGGRSSCMVVLSSNWRFPRHAARVRKLEDAISNHLETPFCFCARTSLRQERCAADRLRCVGDFIADVCSRRDVSEPTLRIVVLEDFFITRLSGWTCDGYRIGNAEAAESYLMSRVGIPANVAVKLLHTYCEYTTSSGLNVEIGSGLTKRHINDADAFLSLAVDNLQPDPAESVFNVVNAPKSVVYEHGPTVTIAKVPTFFQGVHRLCVGAFDRSYMHYLPAMCPMMSMYPSALV
jgi:hypothetical protein